MLKYALITLILIISTPSYSQYCKSDRSKPIVIGCTYQCSRWVIGALVKAARYHKTFIKVVNLIKNPEMKMSDVDAIIIPGGADINPDYYVDKVPEKWRKRIEEYRHLTNISKQSNLRDPFEYELASDYFKNPQFKNTPMLGICRGMQMLTVSQSIPLYQDIKAELGIPNRMYKLDRIHVIDFDSDLYAIQKRKNFVGAQLHHQGMRMDYWRENKSKHPTVKVTALSNKNKIVETIEFTNRPALGVQFHPEVTFGKTRKNIFRWLINRACMKKAMD